MKGKIAILLVFVFTFIIHGVAFGDGGGIPAAPPAPPGNVTGAYVKVIFCCLRRADPNKYTHHNVHAVLQWDRTGAKRDGWRIEKGKV
jgi:hypothetical protein